MSGNVPAHYLYFNVLRAMHVGICAPQWRALA